jgi:hypothetical protein
MKCINCEKEMEQCINCGEYYCVDCSGLHECIEEP